MNPRERWIVYPLLLFALGASFHDKLLKEMQIDRIRCKQLVVATGPNDDQPAVVLGSSPAGGSVIVVRADQKFQLTLGHKEHSSSLFAEAETPNGTATWAVLGNLQRFAPKRAVQWLPELPLFDPQLLHPPTDDKK